MYWRCPDCGKELKEKGSEHFQEEYDSLEIFYFVCDKCGCEFEVREETNVEVEVTQHGTEWENFRQECFNPSKRMKE